MDIEFTNQTPELQPYTQPPATKWWIWVVAGIVLAIVVGGGFWFFRMKSAQKDETLAPVGSVSSTSSGVNSGGVKKPYVDPFPKDLDRDGISNDDEKKLGLDPGEMDSDGDGLSDYDEINVWKTDPKKVDTDGDGFRDGVEIVSGNNPLGQGKLVPKK